MATNAHGVVGWHVAEGVSSHLENEHFMGCLTCTPEWQQIGDNEVTLAQARDEGYRCDTCGKRLLEGSDGD